MRKPNPFQLIPSLGLALLCLTSACGGSSTSNSRPAPPKQPKAALNILAGALYLTTPGEQFISGNFGQISSGSHVDGIGTDARFGFPAGILVDPSGTAFITDTGTYVVRKMTSDSNVSTLCGLPGVQSQLDGPFSAATFSWPSALARDNEGNLYVTDSGRVRKITTGGQVVNLAGSTRGHVDGQGSNAQLDIPCGLVVDSSGTIYVIEDATIRKITSDGQVSTFLGTYQSVGIVDAAGAAAAIISPTAITLDSPRGLLYISDVSGKLIRRIDIASATISTLARDKYSLPGYADGPVSDALFSGITGMTSDASGNLYVCEAGNLTIRKISVDGMVSTLAGSPGVAGIEDGQGSNARFRRPRGITLDGAGNLLVTDETRIRKITPDGQVTTVAGAARMYGYVDGPGVSAMFHSPWNLKVDPSGNLLVHDAGNSAIRKISPNGNTSTVLQFGNIPEFPTSSYGVLDFLVDDSETVYLVDCLGSIIYKVPKGGTPTLVAGTPGTWGGNQDGPLGSNQLHYPSSICRDASGTIYVSSGDTVKTISPDGILSTVAGIYGTRKSQDGGISTATFTWCGPLLCARDGSLYVMDQFCIRKISADRKTVSTLAGSAANQGILDGKGASARFGAICQLAEDDCGSILAAEIFTSVVRKIKSDGTVTTVIGTPGSLQSSFKTLPGSILNPSGVAYNRSTKTLYISVPDAILKGTNF